MRQHIGVIAAVVMAGGWTLGIQAQDWTIEDVAARVVQTAQGLTAQVRWTTKAPTKGKVEYGDAASLGQVAEEDPSSLRGSTNARDSGRGFANNHRADIRWPAYKPFHFRIRATDAAGREVASEARVVPTPTMPAGGAASAGRIPLKVDRGAWKVDAPPVVAGVPFPRGVLFLANAAYVVADNEPIPCQTEAVSRYDDGSICWLRVAFQAPQVGKGVALDYGARIAQAGTPEHAAVKVEGKAFQVSSGLVSIAARADGTGTLKLGQATVPLPRGVLVDKDGTSFPATPEAVTLEEHGAVRTVIRVDGHHRSADGKAHFAYVMRLYAFAGKDYVRCDYTFANDMTAQEMTAFRQLNLRFAGLTAPLVVNGDLKLTDGQRVLQREDNEWVLEPGERKGERLTGEAECGGVRVMLRQCWQQYPKSFAAERDGLVVGLCPALPTGFYAGRKDEDKLYYYLRDGNYTFRQGFSKTHELWLAPASSPHVSTLVADPPVVSCPPDYVEKTGVLRGLAVAARDQFPGYDEALKAAAEGAPAARLAKREFGMMNFGDWYGERVWNWGNLEYDAAHGMLTQFARTGEAVFFHRATEAARHQGDVDTRHYASDDRRIGQQWTHCMGHTAGYYDNTYKDMKVYAGTGWSDNRGHIWAQGLFEHFLWGGDRRSWETAALIADWAAGPQTTNFNFGLAREPGWMLVLVMGAYDATRDPYYLNAAKLMVRKALEKSAATGDRGFYAHELQTGHCNCEKKHSGEAGFMLGVQMTGMKMYYDATADPQAAKAIARIAKFIVESMWEPEVMGFHYTSCPKTGAGPSSAFIMMEGLAFGAQQMNDPQMNQILRQALAASWQTLGGLGKASAYSICSSAQALHEFAKLPGGSLAAYLAEVHAELRSPSRRFLPTLIPNPDFEVDALGWTPRGGVMEHTTEVKHSGAASLAWRGKLERQNEYFNTRYDTGGDATELVWLKPGEKYRLTCWLRVDKLTPGAPAPSVRIAHRDATGSRTSHATNAYDLARLGTWQKLSVDVPVPEWNTRNYIALNTNTREAVEAELYLDDMSLVPVAQVEATRREDSHRAAKDAYVYLRADVKDAKLSGASLVSGSPPPQREFLRGQGSATWTVNAPVAGKFAFWARASGIGKLANVMLDGKPVGELKGSTDKWEWLQVSAVELKAGAHEVTLADIAANARIGRLVLTDDLTGP